MVDSVGVVGREAELAVLARTVAAPPAAAVLVGEPGIGKTTLWRAAVATARDAGDTVLEGRAAGAEVQLSFATLGDLLGEVAPQRLDALPRPQQRALEAALLLREPPPGGVDVRAVGTAARGVLAALAEEAPVVVAIDDAQWVDPSSAEVLAFALRRLRAERVSVLATMRPGTAAPLGLPDAERIEVGPLSLGALQRILVGRSPLRLPRPLLVRIHQTCGGNPLYALELVEALRRRGTLPRGGEPLPPPESLGEAIRERVAELPPETRTLLVQLAARGRPAAGVVDALAPAFTAGLLEERADGVAFTHPLVAAAVYAAATAPERRAAHRRVAESAESLEERALHLAHATDGQDAATAAVVSRAAAQALARGAAREATELCERALRLTPPGDAGLLADRVLLAADANLRAGDAERAIRLVRETLDVLPPGPQRARLLVRLADAEQTVDAADVALAEAEGDDVLVAAAWNARSEAALVADDVEGALAAARRGVEAARRGGEPHVLARSLAHVGFLEAMTGDPAGAARLDEAIALEDPAQPGTVLHGPATTRGIVALWHDDLGLACRTLSERARTAEDVGDEVARGVILQRLARAELYAGRHLRALAIADEVLELREANTASDPISGLWLRALVLAYLGRLGEARAEAGRAQDAAAAVGDPAHFHVRYVRGLVEAFAGGYAAAADLLSQLPTLVEGTGRREPGVCPYHADELEALVRAGRLDRAEARIAEVSATGSALDRPRLRVAAQRARGLLLDARGDTEGALSALRAALVEGERLEMPFERARTALTLGSALRRARQPGEARGLLEEAAAAFEELPAPGFAEQAREELRRIGGRRRGETLLTPSEQRVAELAARGLATKEIAAALVVSPKTVEGHLSRIYAKLGVRTRVALAAKIGAAGVEHPDPLT